MLHLILNQQTIFLAIAVIHSYPLNATSESITESNEKQISNTDIDENIEDMFATYENKFIKNATWIEEDINLRKNTNFDESGSEQADELLHTTQTTNEIVHAVHDIVNGLAANGIQNRTDESSSMDQTATILLTTSVNADASSNTKYKQHHNELSFGNNDLLPRQEKTRNIDGHLDMHNRITTEFFNNISVATEISSHQALTGPPQVTEDNRYLDNSAANLNVSVAVPPNDEITHDPAETFASILDAGIREEFTKDIPGAHHKPAYAEEQMLEYSPLKDSSAFIVKSEQIETTSSNSEQNAVSINSTVVQQ